MGYFTYKDMVQDASSNGISTEKVMWGSIDSLSNMLCIMKEEHPKEYWHFMREQHGIMYGNHYSQRFAEWDVAQIMYTNREGKVAHGGYWTVEQIEQATSTMKFPAGTNKWDKYVAFNAAYADFCKQYDAADILKIGHSFFFADEDWGSTTKIWEYMLAKKQYIEKMGIRDDIRMLLFSLEINEWCTPLFADVVDRLRELLLIK